VKRTNVINKITKIQQYTNRQLTTPTDHCDSDLGGFLAVTSWAHWVELLRLID